MKKKSFILRLLSVLLTHHIGFTLFKNLGVGLGMGFYPNHLYSDKSYHMLSLTLLFINIQFFGHGDIQIKLIASEKKYLRINFKLNEITVWRKKSAGTWQGNPKPIFG